MATDATLRKTRGNGSCSLSIVRVNATTGALHIWDREGQKTAARVELDRNQLAELIKDAKHVLRIIS